MNTTGKRVDVVRTYNKHTADGIKEMTGEEKPTHYENGRPILMEVFKGTKQMFVMAKEVVAFTPTHDCPDWARDGDEADLPAESRDGEPLLVANGGRTEHIYRYDERGDQVCVNCGDIRNQSPHVVHDHQHAGRYDGFATGDGE